MNSKQVLLFTAIIVLYCCLSSCSDEDTEEIKRRIPPPYVSAEEYSVYTDLIESLDVIDPQSRVIPFHSGNYQSFVIRNHTLRLSASDEDFQYISRNISNRT